jgi:DNA repair exonuclease SbcCD ATPase subunit
MELTQTIEFKNFRCHENATFTFPFNPSLVLIDGTSGKGKSTILEGLYYVYFGKIRKPYTFGKKKCRVILTTPYFKITRTSSPNKLTFEKDNKVYEAEDAQSYIETFLNVNEEEFKIGCYAKQNEHTSILSYKPNEQLSILEKISSKNYDIEALKQRTKIRLDDEKSRNVNHQFEVKTLQNQVEYFKSQLENIDVSSFTVIENQKLENVVKEYEKLIEMEPHLQQELNLNRNNQKKYEEKKQIVSDYEKLIEQYSKLESKLNLLKKLNEIQKQQKSKQDEIQKWKTQTEQSKKRMEDYEYWLNVFKLIDDIESQKSILIEELYSIYPNVENSDYDSYIDSITEKVESLQETIDNQMKNQKLKFEKEKLDELRQQKSKLEREISQLDETMKKTESDIQDENFASFNTFFQQLETEDSLDLICDEEITVDVLNEEIEQLEKIDETLKSINHLENLRDSITTESEKTLQKEINKLKSSLRALSCTKSYECPHCKKHVSFFEDKLIKTQSVKKETSDIDVLESEYKLKSEQLVSISRINTDLKKMHDIISKSSFSEDTPEYILSYLNDMKRVRSNFDLTRIFFTKITDDDLKTNKMNIQSLFNKSEQSKMKLVHSKKEYEKLKSEVLKMNTSIHKLSEKIDGEPIILLDDNLIETMMEEKTKLSKALQFNSKIESRIATIQNYKSENPYKDKQEVENVLNETREKQETLFSKINSLRDEVYALKREQEQFLEYEKEMKEINVVKQKWESKLSEYESVVDCSKTITHLEKKITENNLKTRLLSERKTVLIVKEKYDELNEKYEETIQSLNETKQHQSQSEKTIKLLNKFKDCISRAEMLNLYNIIDTLNTQASFYLDEMFGNEPISVSLQPYKVNKNDLTRPQLSLTITLKNELYDEISQLSGGERQRVELAFILAMNDIIGGKILILDECLNNLDGEMNSSILRKLKEFSNKRQLFCVSHESTKGIFDQIIQV